MINNGELGEPIIGYARKNNPISVPLNMLASWAKKSSPAWFMSSHDIDLMTWWFDADPVEVYAKGIKRALKELKGWDTWDGIQALVTYDKGQFATYEASWVYPETSPYMPDSFMEVIGTKGTTHIDRQSEAIDFIGQDKFNCPRTFLGSKVFGEWTGAFPLSIKSFINSIINDTKPHVNEMDGLKNTAVLDAIHRSLETGKPVPITLNK
jgi:predicted dehydrogenase